MRCYLRDLMFSRFDTIPECDRHTHTQTDRHTTTAYTALSKASRGKKIKQASKRANKENMRMLQMSVDNVNPSGDVYMPYPNVAFKSPYPQNMGNVGPYQQKIGQVV